jgi:hypothetical protein
MLIPKEGLICPMIEECLEDNLFSAARAERSLLGSLQVSTTGVSIDVYEPLLRHYEERVETKIWYIMCQTEDSSRYARNGSIDARQPPGARLYNARMEEKQRQEIRV